MSTDEITQAKYRYLTDIQALMEKSWAAGTKSPVEHHELLFTEEYLETVSKTPEVWPPFASKFMFAPCLSKIIDEIIVNAVDHIVRTLDGPARAKNIWITINDDHFEQITIANDGPGVEIQIHTEASQKLGKPIYIPTLIFGTPNQGSNHTPDPSRIIGGINGLGSKITNAFSREFTVDTVSSGKRFIQTWRNNMQKTSKPKISDVRSPDRTIISFTPEYTLFSEQGVNIGKSGIIVDRSAANPVDHNTLVSVVKTRAYLAAAYAGYTSSDCRVHFNGKHIPVAGIKDLANLMFPPSTPKFYAKLTPEKIYAHQKYTWEVMIVVTPNITKGLTDLTIVNGMLVREGKHISCLRAQLRADTKAWYADNYKNLQLPKFDEAFSSCTFLLANCKIPGADWDSQRKEKLAAPGRFPHYVFPGKFVGKLAPAIKEYILANVKAYTPPKSKPIDMTKYIPAAQAGRTESNLCSLILVEGDSVKNHIVGPVAEYLHMDHYGIIDTGGVPMNSRKHATFETINGSRIVCPDKKFIENKFLCKIYKVLGLNYNLDYSRDADMNTLNYGRGIIACVDQDEDGKGNILALVAGYIEQFWPTLIRRGWLRWLQTPIIRVYPRNPSLLVEEFYTVEDFETWHKQNISRTSSYHDPKYYKGVASHSDREIKNIFMGFSRKLVTLIYDSEAARNFHIFLGPDPATRKVELASPIVPLTPQEIILMDQDKHLRVSSYMRRDVKSYQLDNLDRKLPNVVDGMNQVGRKILEGLIKYFAGSRPEAKVSTLAGDITTRTAYQHGEASLFDAIRNKGFIGCGGKQLPIIEIHSNFGTRIEGGADAGSPRYIYCKLNTRLVSALYPDIDYADLPICYEEGTRIEPRYFAPIIPVYLMESMKIPAHGWKNETWAMSYHSVFRAVKALMLGHEVSPGFHLYTYAGTPHAWTGQIGVYAGKTCTYGRYMLDRESNTLSIVELPLRKWTGKYLRGLPKILDPTYVSEEEKSNGAPKAHKSSKKDKLSETISRTRILARAEDIINSSTRYNVNIVVHLAPGAMDYLESLRGEERDPSRDPLIEYFKLRGIISHELNCMSPLRDRVNQYGDDYFAAAKDWFVVRKHHYALRVVRQKLLLELRALRLEQIIKYCEYSETHSMSKLPKATMIARLEAAGFIKIATQPLKTPKDYPTKILRETILESPKSTYDYLLGMGDIDKSRESIDKYQAKLASVQKEYVDLTSRKESFPGESQWYQELDALEKIITEESARGWEPPGAENFTFPGEAPNTTCADKPSSRGKPRGRGRGRGKVRS